MATSFKIIPLSSGDNGPFTADTVHGVICTTNGDVTVTAKGGGSFTIAMTAGNKIDDIIISGINVGSGAFAALAAQSNQGTILRG